MNDFGGEHFEPGALEDLAELGLGRVVVGVAIFDWVADGRDSGEKGGSYSSDVSVSAKLADKLAVWFESAVNASEDGGVIADPVKNGVGKNGIKFQVESEFGCVHDVSIEAALLCVLDHFG